MVDKRIERASHDVVARAVVRVVLHRLGETNVSLEERIKRLDLPQLEALLEAVLDLDAGDDLEGLLPPE